MPDDPQARGPATALAVRHLSSLKPDHQTLLRTLLADPGMASATLETLAEHLLEEEDPRLVRAVGRVKAGHAGAEVAAAVAIRSGSTVGSLRADRDPGPPGRGTVGSLRR